MYSYIYIHIYMKINTKCLIFTGHLGDSPM